MAVAIKNNGFVNIKIYNGGLTDWKRSGLPLESTTFMPSYKGPRINAEQLHNKIEAAEAGNCLNADGNPLLTIIDFRAFIHIKKKIGGDRYRIQTNCPVIYAQLDDFIDNKMLLSRVPHQGLVVCISETGKRDNYLQRYLHTFEYTNIVSLEHGMRGWIKAGYPKESQMEMP